MGVCSPPPPPPGKKHKKEVGRNTSCVWFEKLKPYPDVTIRAPRNRICKKNNEITQRTTVLYHQNNLHISVLFVYDVHQIKRDSTSGM